MRWIFVTLLAVTLGVGCESTSELKTGGYKMIQMNNPECMGASGSGILMVRESDDSIIKAQIAQKTGYCEAITGQVIVTGGEVAGDYLIQRGLGKSGSDNTNTTSTTSGQPIIIPSPAIPSPSPSPSPSPPPD